MMKLTLIHPRVGSYPGKEYLRVWQMESLPMAQIAALTPGYIKIEFWDDRMEEIPFDEPTDLVGISIETYTARRAYQIASEYRKRKIPVVIVGEIASWITPTSKKMRRLRKSTNLGICFLKSIDLARLRIRK